MQNTLYPAVISRANLHTLDLNVIPPCTTLLDTNDHCITIAYAPASGATLSIMTILAEQHKLSIGTALNNSIVGFDSEDAATEYVEAHPNSTQAGKDQLALLHIQV